MSINVGAPNVDELRPRIAVIGVGGAGGNAIANMIEADVQGVDFIVANTDAQALNSSIAENRVQLGPEITQGLGAGSRPEVGKAAAEETVETIEKILDGAHMCFIAAGMGGGTGTGAAPVIAKIAREKKILTVGVVTKPFTFEGSRRMRAAESGIDELQKNVDTLIVIPNQNLFLVANPNTTFKDAFKLADEVLQQGVRSITDLMVMPGLINLDFADVRSVMHEMGKAMMGTGEAEGDSRALEAAEKAIANPLLDGVSMNGAKGVIVSITGGEDMRLMEVDEAANHIRNLVDEDANIIWGSAFNNDLEGRIRVSVVATGIDTDHDGKGESRQFSLKQNPARSTEAKSAPAPAASAPAPSVPEPLVAPTATMPSEPKSAPMDRATDAGNDGFNRNLPPRDHEVSAADARDPAETKPRFASTDIDDGDDNEDELVLDTSDLAEDDDNVPAQGHKPAKPAPSVNTGGGTLFERMSKMNKSHDDDEDDEDGDAFLTIPRFLGRQNNQ